MFVALAALLSTPAPAATYKVQVAIPEAHPSVNLGIPSSHPFGMSRALVLDEQAADSSVASTDPRITCAVKDGWLSVDFLADAADWPTTWPVKARCVHGEDTLKIAVVKMSPATDLSKQPAAIADDTVTLTRIEGALTAVAYALPAGSYTAGTYPSTLAGVRCAVVGDAVRVEMASASEVGTGTCTLPRAEGDYVLNLALDEAAI